MIVLEKVLAAVALIVAIGLGVYLLVTPDALPLALPDAILGASALVVLTHGTRLAQVDVLGSDLDEE